MQLMILFILLFVGFIILTLNYSKTVKVKNEVVSMFEKYEGLNEESIKLVNEFLLASGYAGMGECNKNNDPGVYGSIDLHSNHLEKAQNGTRYHYCVKKYKGANISYYFQVTVFYKFNLPIFGNTGSYVVKGTTGNFQSKDSANYSQSVDGSYSSSPAPGGGYIKPTADYIVNFNTNGGSNVPSQTVSTGSKVSKPSDPTKAGYIFKGWQLSGRDYNFNSIVNSNITLTAKWEKDINGSGGTGNTYFTVNFDLSGGTSAKKNGGSTVMKGISSQKVLSGKTAVRPTDPYKYSPNSSFIEWQLNGSSYDFSKPVTSNITLVAKWQEKVKVSIVSDASCGSKAYRLDGKSSYSLNGTLIWNFDVNDRLKLGNFKLYTGPNYGDNDGNNTYDWVYEYGISKSIKRWETLDGSTFDISKPLINNMVLRAKCE